MIDWERVDELRSEIGTEDFSEVVELFLDEVDEVMARLSAQPDLTRLAADLHFLKGSALNLGFRALAEICENSGRQTNSGQADRVDLAAITACYDASRNGFIAGVDRRGDADAA